MSLTSTGLDLKEKEGSTGLALKEKEGEGRNKPLPGSLSPSVFNLEPLLRTRTRIYFAFGQSEIGDLCSKILVQKNIAAIKVLVNASGSRVVMQILQPLCDVQSDLQPLVS